MSLKLKLILLLVMLLFEIYVCVLIKKKKLMVKHAFIWIIVGIAVMLCIIFVDYLFDVANIFGIEKASNMLFFLSIIFLVIISINLSVQISNQNNKIIKLTQELSLLKKECKDDRENKKD